MNASRFGLAVALLSALSGVACGGTDGDSRGGAAAMTDDAVTEQKGVQATIQSKKLTIQGPDAGHQLVYGPEAFSAMVGKRRYRGEAFVAGAPAIAQESGKVAVGVRLVDYDLNDVPRETVFIIDVQGSYELLPINAESEPAANAVTLDGKTALFRSVTGIIAQVEEGVERAEDVFYVDVDGCEYTATSTRQELKVAGGTCPSAGR